LTQAVSVFASGAADRHWVEKSRIMMGWAMSLQGNTDDGIDAILEGLEGLGGNPLDAGLAHSRYLILLAESYLADDQIEKASDAVARAWQRLESNGEYLWESDLCIVEGRSCGRQVIGQVPTRSSRGHYSWEVIKEPN